MNWKSFTAITLGTLAAGLAMRTAPASAQGEPAAGPSLEVRVAAIEKYLHMEAVEKNQNIVTDAKTFDDLKAAMIKLDTEQDALAARIRNASQSNSSGDNAKSLDEMKRTLDGISTQMRSFEDRLHKAEQKLR